MVSLQPLLHQFPLLTRNLGDNIWSSHKIDLFLKVNIRSFFLGPLFRPLLPVCLLPLWWNWRQVLFWTPVAWPVGLQGFPAFYSVQGHVRPNTALHLLIPCVPCSHWLVDFFFFDPREREKGLSFAQNLSAGFNCFEILGFSHRKTFISV